MYCQVLIHSIFFTSLERERRKAKLSVVVHCCNLSILEDHTFKAILGYIGRPCKKLQAKIMNQEYWWSG
jgi:hypothetical protein